MTSFCHLLKKRPTRCTFLSLFDSSILYMFRRE